MIRKFQNVRNPGGDRWVLSRRVFLKSSAFAAAGLLFRPAWSHANLPDNPVKVRFGIVTDSHYADIDTHGTRHYRESIGKMTECVTLMNDKKVDFVIHLGDFKNGAPSGSIENLRLIESLFGQFNGPRYHVLGNHDMDSISKDQFQSVVENTGINPEHTYYSFDRGGVHFVVLDANFRNDGAPYDSGNFSWTDANLPADQLDWLEADLAATSYPAVICIHQLLDRDEGNHYVRNASDVRSVLERHSNVLTVFQGHQHAGQYNLINDIHYYTLKAMVEGSGEENNSYAIVEVFDDLTLVISGYRKAINQELSRKQETGVR
jgi:alkaline phosphatase